MKHLLVSDSKEHDLKIAEMYMYDKPNIFFEIYQKTKLASMQQPVFT